MTQSKALVLYAAAFRYVPFAIIVTAVALWPFIGGKAACTVGLALFLVDIVVLLALAFRSMNRRG